MADSSVATSEVAIWLAPERAVLVARVLARMQRRIRVIGVGGPRSSAVDQLARQFDLAPEDDLRRLIVEHPPAFLLVADPRELPLPAIAQATSAGALILALEPIATDSADLDSAARAPASRAWLTRVVHLPAASAAAGWLHAADPAQALGSIRSISAIDLGETADGSLFARLFDIWCSILHFADLPESIDASLTGPLPHLPHDLRALTGWLSAHARFANGCSAIIQVSDRCPPVYRALRILGDSAHWHMTELSYTLHDSSGQLLDSWSAPTSTNPGAAARIAEQWTALLDHSAPPSLGSDPVSAIAQSLSCCAACLLSCRTAQPESPAKLQSLPRRG